MYRNDSTVSEMYEAESYNYTSETETFKTMARDTTFFNEMLIQVAKTELRSKTLSPKIRNYLKFMQQRLNLG